MDGWLGIYGTLSTQKSSYNLQFISKANGEDSTPTGQQSSGPDVVEYYIYLKIGIPNKQFQ